MSAVIVGNCPRCGASNSTFDCHYASLRFVKYNWQMNFELYVICRHCKGGSILLASERSDAEYDKTHKNGLLSHKDSLNNWVNIDGYISMKDENSHKAPEFTPQRIASAFDEGAKCLAVECWNAAGAMFRLCIDLTTKEIFPAQAQVKRRVRRELAARLEWLFANGHLPASLKDLSSCVREDGNDAAHAGNLSKVDSEDLAEFSAILLERIFTEPERIKQAEARRLQRRTTQP